MEKPIRVPSRLNNKIYTDAIPGHFATNHSHINYYLDMTAIKHSRVMATEAAKVIAGFYSVTSIDTIICLEGTEYIGAYLSQELSKGGMGTINDHRDIWLVEPESNVNGQFIFADNLRPMIEFRDVLILVGSASTGQTLSQIADCVMYYGGRVAGYVAMFANIETLDGKPVVHLFSGSEFPHYQNCAHGKDCPDCKRGKPLDALVTPVGYTKL